MGNITDFIKFKTMQEAWQPHDPSHECILIPQSFAQSIQQMCEYSKETAGCLLGYKTGTTTIIESIHVLGKGDEISVHFNQERLTKRALALAKHPGLISIDFHTHPKHLDSKWWDSFSSQDLNLIAKLFNNSNEYRHIWFTPTHVGTLTIPKPQLFFLSEQELSLMKYQYWEKELDLQ